jgi:predicted acylesterase/phospholipase RssA
VTHVPHLAAGDGDRNVPRRSLVLAGGGMRVAWQAGVLRALEEAGLIFAHADGTSGGTINLAMLLSGHSPPEMCQRWRTLRVRDFASPLSLREYLRAPHLPALGDADGIVGKVFPHLGIEVERIHEARGITGTFNVCNHSTKTLESIEHPEIELELLVAGISLPVLMPAVRRNSSLYTDPVWIKDANLTGAVKRGAEELWIVWCIGNTPEYRDGPFNQYVHMIEQSANGALFEEFDRIRVLNDEIRHGRSQYGQRRPVVAHVITPRYPLPLDPDFYLGRIDAATLIAMGYRDARAYLAEIDAEGGVPLTPAATRMEQPGLGVIWRERHVGQLAALAASGARAAHARLTIELAVEIADAGSFIAGPRRSGRLVGRLDDPLVGDVLLRDGTVALEDGALVYKAAFDRDGRGYQLAARHAAGPANSPLQRLRELKVLQVSVRDDEGKSLAEGRLAPAGGPFAPTLSGLTVSGATSTWQRLTTAASFARFLLSALVSWRY